jgi:purine-binding chemotaxis protein CheW
MDDYFFPEKSEAEELLPLICFQLGDEQYALDIACVREVLRLAPVTRVPQMPDFVLGVINARGNIIPVFDFRRKFGLGGKALNEKAKIIVVDVRETPVCFVADELLDNVKIERSSIAPAPRGKLKIPQECVEGVSRLDERVILILDLDKMYESAQEDIRNFSP